MPSQSLVAMENNRATKVYIIESDYSNPIYIVDVNLFDLNSFKSVLAVCPREGAKYRLRKSKAEGLHNAEVMGWWDIFKKDKDYLRQFDAIFIIDPERISLEAARTYWYQIAEQFS